MKKSVALCRYEMRSAWPGESGKIDKRRCSRIGGPPKQRA